MDQGDFSIFAINAKHMRLFILLSFATVLIIRCSPSDMNNTNVPNFELKKDTNQSIQLLFDSTGIKGSVVIYDISQNTLISNSFDFFEQGYLPASTFKIANTIIGLEAGVIKNENHIFKWDSIPRRLFMWNTDLTLQEAFSVSCVPCFQEVARNIGAERMNQWLKKLDYGTMQVTKDNIDVFWLEGESTISQQLQIRFLVHLYYSQLPIQTSTERIIKSIMLQEENDDYSLSGKTGWAIRDGNNIGWFVGWIETKGKVYFFATLVFPEMEFNMDFFPVMRKDITLKAMKTLGLL